MMRSLLIMFFLICSVNIFAQEKKAETLPCDSSIFMPTTFSGSGDGVNDVFRPLFSNRPVVYQLQIFNRWGMVVFESKDVDEGWTGTDKDKKPASMGTYFWILKYKNQTNELWHQCQGSVNLVR